MVYDHCIIDSQIKASEADKLALKQSTVSQEFIAQIVNHNDVWELSCPKESE